MRVLLLIFLFFISNHALSQSFYEVKWKLDGTNYTALIEFFTTENINVRVKYKSNGQYFVAKFKSKGILDTQNDYFALIGRDARIVYPHNYERLTSYIPDHFYFTERDYTNQYKKLYAYTDADQDGEIENLTEATYRILDPSTDFSDQYLYNFYDRHEPEYSRYMNLTVSNSSSSGSSSSSSSSSTYDHYKLKFKNKCHEAVRTFIRFKNYDGDWESKGWWTIQPNETVYVEDTKNGIFYYYAESKTSTKKWSGKDNYKTFGGKKYGLKKKESSRNYGVWTTNLTCKSDSGSSGSSGSTIVSNPSPVKIHLVFAADVDDPSIGTSTRHDMNDITNLFKKAAKEINVKFKAYKLYGDNFDRTSINSTLNNMSVGSNDVVIFYYSGHGYNNTRSFNKFPNMDLDGSDASLESIHRKIKNKNPRLTITIGDLCNSIPRLRNRASGQTEIPFKSGFLFDYTKLTKLFIKTRGDLISTSSRKGQWSYTMGNDANGQFTNAFIHAFTQEASKVSNANGSWTNLLNTAYNEARYKTRNERNQDGAYGQSGTNTSNLKF
jgi:hypothetical protein